MKGDLLSLEKLTLQRAVETNFQLPVTGFLLDAVMIGSVCIGYVYHHAKADPLTGRFSNGHMMHTSSVGSIFEHAGFPVLITCNSVYVCVVLCVEELETFLSHELISQPLYH